MKTHHSVSLDNRPNSRPAKKSGQWLPNRKLVRLVDEKVTDRGLLTYGNYGKTW
jgi:hypothetical protein